MNAFALGVVWLTLSCLLALGLGRWFRYMRDGDGTDEW